MAIRTSEGIYLEVLTSAPVAGVPLEIDVYGGNNIATMLATLEGAQEAAFTDPFGDIGSGHFRIPTTDPKATGSIIRSGNYIKVKIAGLYRYAFFLENPRKIIASTDGEAGEYWDLGGRGNIAYLERGSVYPPGWPTPAGTTHEYTGVTAAFIFDQLLAAAKARGALPQLTWDFSATRDSDNAPWTDSLTMSIPAGMSLLDLWRQFVGMGYESEMTPDLRLRFWKDRSRDFSQTVIFRAGKHLRGEVTRDPQDAGLRTRILVQGDGGRFLEATDPVLEGDAYIGRREGYLSFTASTDPTTLQQVGDNALAEVSLASEALSVPLHHGIGNGDYEPFADYRNGDWVGVNIPGTYTLAKVRVRSLSIKAIAGGDYQIDADFNSVSLEHIVRLKRIVDALGGGGSASGVVGSTGGSLSSSGGASSGSTGRVGVEQGDTPGYLYDKLGTTARLVKALGGVPGNRQVTFDLGTVPLDDLSDVSVAGADAPTDGQVLGWVNAAGLWKPRTPAAGGGGTYQPGSADVPPASPNAKDDEFATGPSVDAKWTAYGTVWDTVNVHAFRQHHLYGRRSVNTSVISGYYQAIGAFPLTVISKLGASTFRGNYARGGGIVILPTGAIASPSPVVYWGWLFNGQRLLTAVRHSALGSWATDIGSTAVGALSEAAYVRFRFNSATSVDIEWSADGYAWISLVAAYNPGWTMDKFGVGFSSEGGGVPLECTWDFVRAT